jgi:antitoxin (DNA-binding transcriptional repressor) of toxin-antitoxin stability system
VDGVFREKERVIVEKSGIPVAVIIPVGDFDSLLSNERRRRASFDAMEEISRAFADVPLEELEREVERAIAEVRAKRRAAALSAVD